MCQACYKLDLAVRNNPRAAKAILEEHQSLKPRGLDWYNPYTGTIPKEEQ